MKDYDLIDIDESKLPDVTLSEKELDKIAVRLIKSIKPENISSMFNINASASNILNTVNELKDDAIVERYGVKYVNVLEQLVIQALDKEMSSLNLLYKGFYRVPYNLSSPMFYTSWTTIETYFAFYLTASNLYIYSFNTHYKLVDRRIVSIGDIECVEIKEDGFRVLDKLYDILKIKLNSKKYPSNNTHTLIIENMDDAKNFVEKTLSFGINNKVPKRQTSKGIKIYLYITWGLWLLFAIYMFITYYK